MILKVVPQSLPRQFGAVPGIPPAVTPSGAQTPALGSRASRNAGSLIEVLIATVILSILGAGIVGSMNYGMVMMRLARENARATQVLLEKSEALRLYTWDQIVNSNGFLPSTFTAAYDPQGGTNGQGCTYYGTITTSNLPPGAATSYSANMRQITIGLQWTNFNISHSRSITTYIAQNGLQNYVY